MMKTITNKLLAKIGMILILMGTESFADEWVYPVGNPFSMEGTNLTSDYMNYYDISNSTRDYHLGADMNLRNASGIVSGVKVRSVSKGRVIHSESSGGWGNLVVIRHDFQGSNRYIFSVYAHLNSLSVTEGDLVHAGEPIGIMGSTGDSTATHLHFQMFSVNNGYKTLDNSFDIGYLVRGYTTEPITDRPFLSTHSNGDIIATYNPLMFIKFARGIALVPISVSNYSINGDNGDNGEGSSPSSIVGGNNVIEVNIANFRPELYLQSSVHLYKDNNFVGTYGGVMTKVEHIGGPQKLSNAYNPLGDNLEEHGWNREYYVKYKSSFNIPSEIDANIAYIALYWKPSNYTLGGGLLLAIPGGNAYNTFFRAGRFVKRGFE